MPGRGDFRDGFHRMRAWLLRVTAVLAAVSGALAAEPLPAAPAGFTWSRLAEIRADLLVPTGWKLSRQKKGDSETYHLAGPKAGAGAGAAFDINWVPEVTKKTAMSPSKYAAGLVSAASDSHKLLDKKSSSTGVFATASFRYADSGKGRDGMMVSYEFLANDRTGSLYIVAFEAPAATWADAWAIGKVLFENLRLDPVL